MLRHRSAAAVAGLLLWGVLLAGAGGSGDPGRTGEWAAVEHVVDGDTVRLTDGRRVRLIGINSPEYEPWRSFEEPYGKQAGEHLERLVEGRRVKLEYDRERKDRYGRTLAYLYLPDGRSVNRMIVEEGLAKAIYIAPNGRHYADLKAAERSARSGRKGLWAGSL